MFESLHRGLGGCQRGLVGWEWCEARHKGRHDVEHMLNIGYRKVGEEGEDEGKSEKRNNSRRRWV